MPTKKKKTDRVLTFRVHTRTLVKLVKGLVLTSVLVAVVLYLHGVKELSVAAVTAELVKVVYRCRGRQDVC